MRFLPPIECRTFAIGIAITPIRPWRLALARLASTLAGPRISRHLGEMGQAKSLQVKLCNKNARSRQAARREICVLGYRPAAIAMTRGCVCSARPTYILYDWYTPNSTAIRVAIVAIPLTVLKVETIAVNPAPIT